MIKDVNHSSSSKTVATHYFNTWQHSSLFRQRSVTYLLHCVDGWVQTLSLVLGTRIVQASYLPVIGNCPGCILSGLLLQATKCIYIETITLSDVHEALLRTSSNKILAHLSLIMQLLNYLTRLYFTATAETKITVHMKSWL